MPEIENQKPVKYDFDHVAQTLLTALVGFILSVFLILIALIILMRFYAFENVLYMCFVTCFLLVGLIFNVTSVNLTLNEYPESLHILPFVAGTPITLFWTVFCIVIPYFKDDIFSQFSQLPIATYDSVFYDGLGYNPENKSVHPFVKVYRNDSVFGNSTFLVILLIILASKLNPIDIIRN